MLVPDRDQFRLIDLFERKFVLLTNTVDQGWSAAGRQAADELGVPHASFSIGPSGYFQPEQGDWMELYGIGAILGRPDGHIAWRPRSGRADPLTTMRSVLCTLVRRRAFPSNIRKRTCETRP